MQTILRILLIIALLYSMSGYMLHEKRPEHVLKAWQRWHVIVEEGLGITE